MRCGSVGKRLSKWLFCVFAVLGVACEASAERVRLRVQSGFAQNVPVIGETLAQMALEGGAEFDISAFQLARLRA